MKGYKHQNRCTIAASVALLFFFILVFSPSMVTAQETGLDRETGQVTEDTGQLNKNSSEKEQKTVKLDDIVVSATKTEITVKETGSSVTIITGEELEKSGINTFSDAIKNAPGLAVARNSFFGGKASVFMRGTNSQSVVFLIDGVKMNDPSTPNGSFDFANLMVDNIERIEIIRGTQSVVHGSDAIGGVINIITKKGTGKPEVTITGEAGSYSTFRESLSLTGSNDKYYYSLSASQTDSKGISKASKDSSATGNFDDDPYRNNTITTRIGANPADGLWIHNSLRYSKSNYEVDDGANEDDPNHRNEENLFTNNLTVDHDILSFWKQSLRLSFMTINRRDKDTADSIDTAETADARYEGTRRKAEWIHTLSFGKVDDLTIGLEIEKETYSGLAYYGFATDPVDKEAWMRSAFALNTLKLLDRIFLTAGARYTEPQYVDSETCYQFGASIILPVTETRLKSTYSTGYKVPTLYQLYNDFAGNEELEPEKSISYDIGFEQPLLNNKIFLSATYFHIDYEDMINGDASTGWVYYNMDEAEIDGFECTASILPIDSLRLDIAYTYMDPINTKTDEKLLRRPEHKFSSNINYTFLERANLNLKFLYVGEREDVNDETLDSYYKLDLYASYWVIDNIQVFGKIDNLSDEEYEEVYGYNTPGRSYYAGLKAVL